jgi:hypothetical protein
VFWTGTLNMLNTEERFNLLFPPYDAAMSIVDNAKVELLKGWPIHLSQRWRDRRDGLPKLERVEKDHR